jgi:hemerythrin
MRRIPGVKRHRALVPLSHDHHHELVWGRRLQGGADAGAAERADLARRFVDHFRRDMLRHFRDEEETVFPLLARHHPTPLLEQTLREHRVLHGRARELEIAAASGNVDPELLRTTGELIVEHVRREERELFELVQQVVPEDELARIELQPR